MEESVSIAQVEEIVENCKTGRCDCMTESTKQKVEFIQVKDSRATIIVALKTIGGFYHGNYTT